MRHFRLRPRSEAGVLAFPLLLSCFMMIAVTAPIAAFQLLDFHTHAWHTLPAVEGGITLGELTHLPSESWEKTAQVHIDLFSDGDHSLLMAQGNYYSMDGDYDELSGCIGSWSFHPWNLENLGEHLVERHNYIQARWNLPNREDGTRVIKAFLRIDSATPMRDVDRVLETLESAGVSDVNYVGARAKNP